MKSETEKKFWNEWTTVAIKKETKMKLRQLLIKKRFYNYDEVINYLLKEVENND